MNGNRRKKTWLVALVVLQALFVLGVAGSYYAINWTGKEIRLATTPVDPRDLFYGDYVILNYEISNVSNSLWRGETAEPEYGSRVYVVLRYDGGQGVHHVTAVYPHKPANSEVGAEEVVIPGRARSWSFNTIRIEYGLERYYVPEGTGKELEDRREGMHVLAKVAPWGATKIVELYWVNE